MDLKKYLLNFFSRKKLNKNVSFFAFWDKNTILPDDVYLGPTARLMNCKIGRYTRIKPGCVFKNVDVGSFCSIANSVMAGLGMHPTQYVSTNSIFYKAGINDKFAKPISFSEEKRITIGNDVLIGNGAVILDGVKIGNGAIIAARAVVTKDVDDYAIVGGIPAKTIKYRFDENVRKTLLEIKWWELSDDEISNVLDIFTDPVLTENKLREAFCAR